MLLTLPLLLKQLQVMPNHTNNRLLISGKLQTKSLLGLAGIQNRENVRSTAIVGQVSTLHGFRKVASNNILDLIESKFTSAFAPISSSNKTTNLIPSCPLLDAKKL